MRISDWSSDVCSSDLVPTAYTALSDPATPLEQLYALPDAYDAWIAGQVGLDVGQNLEAAEADQERAAHSRDLDAYRRESGYIRAGIDLLDRKSTRLNSSH